MPETRWAARVREPFFVDSTFGGHGLFELIAAGPLIRGERR